MLESKNKVSALFGGLNKLFRSELFFSVEAAHNYGFKVSLLQHFLSLYLVFSVYVLGKCFN